jgi:uncharacterized protein
MLAIYD